MPTLASVVDELAADLGDFVDQGGPLSFNRYSRSRISAALQEGMCLIATVFKPSDFEAVLEIPLVAGNVQIAQVGAAKVTRLLSIHDNCQSERTVQTLNQSAMEQPKSAEWANLWVGRKCDSPPGGALFPLNVTPMHGSSRSWMFSKPIPQDGQYTMRVLAKGVAPSLADLDDVAGCAHFAAAREYARSVLLASHMESVASLTAGQDALKRALGLTNFMRQNEAMDKVAV
jgi:hypothetical protein